MIQSFFHRPTGTMTYLLYNGSDAVVIDPCLDFDLATMHAGRKPLDCVIDFIRQHKLTLHWILETHIHADHVSGASILRDEFQGSRIAISSAVMAVQEALRDTIVFNNRGHDDLHDPTAPFDRLLDDNDVIEAGTMRILAMATPGHTPACMSFLWHDSTARDLVFTGDSLFMPDFGTGRCDFKGGNASQLYESIKRLYKLPPETNVYVGHTYPAEGAEPKFCTTIGEEMATNVHVRGKPSANRDETTIDEFVRFREARDKTLSLPKLYEPSLYFNLRGAVSDLLGAHD